MVFQLFFLEPQVEEDTSVNLPGHKVLAHGV